jgi:hypothetical protein
MTNLRSYDVASSVPPPGDLVFQAEDTRLGCADMSRSRRILISVAGLIASASLVACTRASHSQAQGAAGTAGSTVGEDVKGVAKATEKTVKDIGRDVGDATNRAGAGGEAAWITTKVKSELTSNGIDPLHVHVDTEGKVVTLSGTVASTTEAQKAVGVARTVSGVVAVKDHLFVKPARR